MAGGGTLGDLSLGHACTICWGRCLLEVVLIAPGASRKERGNLLPPRAPAEGTRRTNGSARQDTGCLCRGAPRGWGGRAGPAFWLLPGPPGPFPPSPQV